MQTEMLYLTVGLLSGGLAAWILSARKMAAIERSLAKKTAEYDVLKSRLEENLETQKRDLQQIRGQFNTEFENLASRILEEKTQKFTNLNRESLTTLLKPLGENLEAFKKKVEDVYDKESKERFSLGREVEKLVLANQRIGAEAANLAHALTANSKSMGDWGQMILESILEKSGLMKGREYFVQEYLKDEHGHYLVNEAGQKMQPDVTVVYPDNRKVIVDAKVSLAAFTRYTAAASREAEAQALQEHLRSVRRHIDDLSRKNYQDFAPSLDFVMLFVPVEPAYLAALQADPELWNYAYHRRILLTSPSNLIVALKMIVDLWKRDNQSRNHQAIAERGGKLYDKFFGVLESLREVGSHLASAHRSYNKTIGRLGEGNDNLLKQVEKLKDLGASAKRNLPRIDSFPLQDMETEYKPEDEPAE